MYLKCIENTHYAAPFKCSGMLYIIEISIQAFSHCGSWKIPDWNQFAE